MSACLDNYINGNLSDAKRQAKNKSHRELREELRDEYGYSETAASAATDFLKGQRTFQESCDIIHAERDAGRMPGGV